MKITFVQGDITDQDVDAIVNAANHTLLGGGGVDGAIHRRGGPEILAECKSAGRSSIPTAYPQVRPLQPQPGGSRPAG